MLAVPLTSFVSLPIPIIPDIKGIVTSKVKEELEIAVVEFKTLQDELENIAYASDKSIEDIEKLEALEDFLLSYSDMLEDTVSNDNMRSQPYFNSMDNLYTIVLKILTALSYIRSKHRQTS